MAELISLVDVPAIPSSMDSIYTGSSTPLALTAAGMHAILRRTKSMVHFNGNLNTWESVAAYEEHGDGEDASRGRAKSPIRANSSRRRSAAPLFRAGVGSRCQSRISRRPSSPSPRHASVELGTCRHREVLSRSVSRTSSEVSRTSSQRCLSRGRTRRRETFYHGNTKQTKKRQYNRQRSILRRRHFVQNGTASSNAEAECPLSSDTDNSCDGDISYVAKGAKWLQKNRGPNEFRFPEYISQPEPTWRAGDGFSGDEARPHFTFLMTGKHKRKRSRSLSALGQLSVDDEISIKNDAIVPNDSRLRQGPTNKLQIKSRSTEVKSTWPTRENFAESSVSKISRRNIPDDRSVISSTEPFESAHAPVAKLELRQAIPRKRQASDFENFGQRNRRPQSDHQKCKFILSTDTQRQCEENDNAEEEDVLHGDLRKEREEWNKAEGEFERVPAAGYNHDNNENYSE
ncbi:hypothetical protein F5Y19DRAFT_476713 [Xylariaceae sp. FL1651]|nr:hypothetical protein F5Y19DRAFT_476713 [Xylariaceae sp. FL1651]